MSICRSWIMVRETRSSVCQGMTAGHDSSKDKALESGEAFAAAYIDALGLQTTI